MKEIEKNRIKKEFVKRVKKKIPFFKIFHQKKISLKFLTEKKELERKIFYEIHGIWSKKLFIELFIILFRKQ